MFCSALCWLTAITLALAVLCLIPQVKADSSNQRQGSSARFYRLEVQHDMVYFIKKDLQAIYDYKNDCGLRPWYTEDVDTPHAHAFPCDQPLPSTVAPIVDQSARKSSGKYCKTSDEVKPRIAVAGQDGQLPSMAYIVFRGGKDKKSVCLGALVGERMEMILTLASCVGPEWYDARGAEVHMGFTREKDFDPPYSSGEKRIQVRRVQIICKLNKQVGDGGMLGGEYDLAVVKVEYPFERSAWVQPACFDPREQHLDTADLVSAGFERFYEKSTPDIPKGALNLVDLVRDTERSSTQNFNNPDYTMTTTAYTLESQPTMNDNWCQGIGEPLYAFQKCRLTNDNKWRLYLVGLKTYTPTKACAARRIYFTDFYKMSGELHHLMDYCALWQRGIKKN